MTNTTISNTTINNTTINNTTINNRIAAGNLNTALDILSEELGPNALIDDICNKIKNEQLIEILTEIAAENSLLEDINA